MQQKMYTEEQINQIINQRTMDKLQEILPDYLKMKDNFRTEAPVEKTLKSLYPTHLEIELREGEDMKLVGKGSIYCIRATGKWGVAYYLKGQGNDKERKVKTFNTEDEARSFFHSLIEEVGNLKVEVTDKVYYDDRYKMGQYIDDYLKEKKSNLKRATIKQNNSTRNTILKYLDEEMYIQQITKDSIKMFLKNLDKGEAKKGKEKMVKVYSLLKQILKEAAKDEVIDRKCIDYLDCNLLKETVDMEQSEEVGSVNIETVDKLLEVYQRDIRKRSVILTLCRAGLRASELCALRWCDVDLEKSTIYVNGTITNSLKGKKIGRNEEQIGTVVRTMPKTLTSIREIPMAKTLKEAIIQWKNYIETSEKEKVNRQKNGTVNMIFTNEYGNVLRVQVIRKWLDDDCKKNEIYERNKKGERVTVKPHMLRHFFATTVYDATNDIYVVSKLLGHKNIEMTRRYIGERPASKINAIKMTEESLE